MIEGIHSCVEITPRDVDNVNLKGEGTMKIDRDGLKRIREQALVTDRPDIPDSHWLERMKADVKPIDRDNCPINARPRTRIKRRMR